MEIIKNKDGEKLTVEIIGRLDTNTAPELDAALNADYLADVKELELDLKQLDYISSAGLRVLLSLQKTMNKNGEMCLVNVNSEVNEVFEITGFLDILTIK